MFNGSILAVAPDFWSSMLNRQNRLTKNGSFAYVYRKGAVKRLGSLSLSCVMGGSGAKVGFSVPNKVGKAVVRNKLKRRLRAIVRARIGGIRRAQIVIAAKPGADKLSFCELSSAVDELLISAQLCAKKT